MRSRSATIRRDSSNSRGKDSVNASTMRIISSSSINFLFVIIILLLVTIKFSNSSNNFSVLMASSYLYCTVLNLSSNACFTTAGTKPSNLPPNLANSRIPVELTKAYLLLVIINTVSISSSKYFENSAR